MKTIERETTHDCKQCKKEQEEVKTFRVYHSTSTVDSNLLHLLKILQKFASRAIVYNEIKAEEI